MTSLLGKIQKSIVTHGVLITTRKGVAAGIRYLVSFTPQNRRNRTLVRDEDLEFDRRWGVDTSGTFDPHKSEVTGTNWVHGADYQGVGASAVYDALSGLAILYQQFTFIDFGSGKGRAILTASRFPFRNVIGVEYSKPLNDIARRNLSRFPIAETKSKLVEVICADAATFPIPPGPLVIFLYNPFGRPVMEKVAQNVLSSYLQSPRRIIILYFNSVWGDVWTSCGFLHETWASKCDVIYDTQHSLAAKDHSSS
jgi:predicted RNA methylase